MIRKNPLSKTDRIVMFIASLLLALFGVICTVLTGMIALHADAKPVYVVCLLYLAVCDFFLFGFAYLGIASTEMRFRVDAEGVHVQYPFRRWRLLRWADCQQVCIANEINRGRYTPIRGVPVICIVKKGEVEGRLNGRWKMHNLFHLYGVITLSYTDEFLALVKENCPLDVVDIRNHRNYRV